MTTGFTIAQTARIGRDSPRACLQTRCWTGGCGKRALWRVLRLPEPHHVQTQKSTWRNERTLRNDSRFHRATSAATRRRCAQVAPALIVPPKLTGILRTDRVDHNVAESGVPPGKSFCGMLATMVYT